MHLFACKACTHVVYEVTIISCTRQFVELDVEWRYRVTIYADFHAIAQNFRDHYVGQSPLFARFNLRRANYHVYPTITRYAIRRRPITRVSPLIGISQDRKMVRAKRKETFIRRHTEEGVGPSTV